MYKYINNYDNFFFNQKTQVKFKSMHRWIIFTFTIIKTPYSTMVLQLQLIDSTQKIINRKVSMQVFCAYIYDIKVHHALIDAISE